MTRHVRIPTQVGSYVQNVHTQFATWFKLNVERESETM
jgi:hypothetical protein